MISDFCRAFGTCVSTKGITVCRNCGRRTGESTRHLLRFPLTTYQGCPFAGELLSCIRSGDHSGTDSIGFNFQLGQGHPGAFGRENDWDHRFRNGGVVDETEVLMRGGCQPENPAEEPKSQML